VLLVAVNLDPYNRQGAWLNLPLDRLGIPGRQSYLVHDLLGEDKFVWQGSRNHVDLDPHVLPGRIFRVRRGLRRETDFDYFF
jgi:starch synthase (maltosyl-transferring)